MGLFAFGGFIVRLLETNKSQKIETHKRIPKRNSYVPIRTQVGLTRTVDRINKNIQRLEVHEKRIYKLKSIATRIDRIENYMNTYDFKQLNADYPGTEQELLDEIQDLRYQAQLMLNT